MWTTLFYPVYRFEHKKSQKHKLKKKHIKKLDQIGRYGGEKFKLSSKLVDTRQKSQEHFILYISIFITLGLPTKEVNSNSVQPTRSLFKGIGSYLVLIFSNKSLFSLKYLFVHTRDMSDCPRKF